MTQLRITEIFYSLQGETCSTGIPTVFIRLTGCPLRCSYCDTAYAFHGGRRETIASIIEQARVYGTTYVTVTGGEPLAQKECPSLLQQLCDEGFQVSLETSGALDVAVVDPRVVKILDVKTPGSGEAEKNRWGNLNYLSCKDQIKFVICHAEDYGWSKEIIQRYRLTQRCQVLFSPSYETMSAEQLADWILKDKLGVRFQIQLHKYLWGDTPGR